MLEIRKSLDKEEVLQKSDLVTANLLSLPEFIASRVVLLYVSFRNEVDTSGIIQACHKAGKTVALPRTIRSARKLVPVVYEPGAPLTPGEYGIPEPVNSCEIATGDLDFVCVPGVAFSVNGARLGYGGGYYDRLLADPAFRAFACGLAFDFQVVKDVPVSSLDRPVNAIVTEFRIIRCGIPSANDII